MGFKVKQKSIKRTTIGAASLLALACTPPTDIFTPVSGTSFNSSEATVVIEGLDMATAVCYTTDGSEPVWNNGTCSGGTTQRIQGPVVSANIEIACGDDTGENVARTVNVQHDWNGQVGFGASANYFLNCGESDGGGSDGGGSDGGGEQPQNLTLTSTADAYVDVSAPNQNFGSDAAMLVDLDPNELHSYLKFDVPELTASLESATLRVYGTNASPNGPRIYTTGNNWSEGGITWNNKPSPNSDVIADTPALSTGWIEIDVTDAISGSGQISFVMIPDDNDGFDFESREAANQPELVIITGDGGNNGGNDGGSNGEDSANGNSAMNVGERLYSNEYLVSSNGLYRFYLQSDGNLVLRDWQTRDSLWSSKTHNQNGVRLSLQSDSNLVLYTGTGAPVWASNTVGAGADRLVLNDDGSLALYQGNSVVWSVNGDGGNNGGGDTGGGDTGGNGNIQHIGTNETYDSNGQGLRISRPSGSQTGDLLVLALHRTDDYLPLRIGGGWTRAAECLKRDNGYDCVTYDDCSSWLDGDFCESFGDYGRGARDLAQAIFYKRVGSSEPSSYTFDMNPDTNGHPGWAILTALRGANTSNPIRDWANEGCDNNNDSLFPSVYAQSGDMVLLSQSFDDAVAQNKFGAPTGTSTFGYVSQSDEAGFLYGGIVDSTGETGSMKTHGDGASGCKDALISLSIRSE